MIISIASGKGGTGKTLVATSLALALKERQDVQLLDCDVEEPNAHIFLKPVLTHSEPVIIPIPVIDETKCIHCGRCAEVCAFHAIAVIMEKVLVFPELCHGCGACSYLCPQQAINEQANEIGIIEGGYANDMAFMQGSLAIAQPMAPPVIRKIKQMIRNEGVVIIDSPPGTSCSMVEAVKDSDYCVLVTEPTPFGLNDLILAIATVRQLAIPCGIVLNKKREDNSETEAYCRKEKIPVLLTIPQDREIAVAYSQGIPLIQSMPQYTASFQELFDKIRETVHERNSNPQR